MDYTSHSSNDEKGIKKQPYSEHTLNVESIAQKSASKIVSNMKDKKVANYLRYCVSVAGEFHDLGKLDEENQVVLNGIKSAKRLPVIHSDAGCKYLRDKGEIIPATLVYAHHIGLPDMSNEGYRSHELRKSRRVITDPYTNDPFTESRTDSKLDDYLKIHKSLIPEIIRPGKVPVKFGDDGTSTVFLRMALSCLVNGDHYDTARNYASWLPYDGPDLKPAMRLEKLDKYVSDLYDKSEKNERNKIRMDVYNCCRNFKTDSAFSSCDGMVGTGKTTSITANGLAQAERYNLNKVFLILPYTSIIDQNVEVLQKAIVLDGENVDDVVAPHHHSIDFSSPAYRMYSTTWNAPFVVTTAVQFFETLASSKPGQLRKLHQVSGSVIIIDETQSSLPIHLWKVAWRWLKILTEQYGCKVILSSGTLSKFWRIKEIMGDGNCIQVPQMISDRNLRRRMIRNESNRVEYHNIPNAMNLEQMVSRVQSEPCGPKCVVLNTLKGAALAASLFSDIVGRDNVIHLSTSLSGDDRKRAFERVETKIERKETNWYFICTSCGETGLNYSFSSVFREECAHNNLHQAGGRCNRNFDFDHTCPVYSFKLQDDLVNANPTFSSSARVLSGMFNDGIVGHRHCTTALRRELMQRTGLWRNRMNQLMQWEDSRNFPQVNANFRCIETESELVFIDTNIMNMVIEGEYVSHRDIQNATVQIPVDKLSKWKVRSHDVTNNGEVTTFYEWTLGYDSFLGYMSGVLAANL